MSFIDYAKRLHGEIPKLPFQLAQTLINDARRALYQAHDWSFLFAQDYLILPAILSTGTLSVTRGSNRVVPDATAKAVFDIYQSTYGVPLTETQLRTGSGLPLPLAAYDSSGSGSLTLETAYPDVSNASASYRLYRSLITPPPAASTDGRGDAFLDFLAFRLIRNQAQAFNLLGDAAPLRTQGEINQRDPARNSTGQAYWVSPFDTRPTAPFAQRFELWPHQTSQLSLFCIYQKKGLDFIDDADVLPPAIPEDLLMQAARVRAYSWADTNKGLHRELLPVNWERKASAAMDPGRGDGVPQLLARAKRDDLRITMAGWLGSYYESMYGRSAGIIGANFAMSHAVALGNF